MIIDRTLIANDRSDFCDMIPEKSDNKCRFGS